MLDNINMLKTEIRDYILNQLSEHPGDIASITAKKFHVSRQTTASYLNTLSKEGLVTANGRTRARKYELKKLVEQKYYEQIVPNMEEDVIWREKIYPFMGNLNANVVDICQYGFTEMLRNVFDHSESEAVFFSVERNAVCVQLNVMDNGVGIFHKIQKDFHLSDSRHALLELSKGKLTSDPKGHTGEGIFFTSRMFDSYCILSEPLYYSRTSEDESDWLIEVGESNQKGTLISMKISPYSKRTTQDVFNTYSPDKETYGFTKTHVPIQLARYEGEQLVSRSQARRLLARFERFSEVLLDFKGVKTIGQAFADEIFRVYQLEHPATEILWVNTTQDVDNMISRAKYNLEAPTKQLPLLPPP